MMERTYRFKRRGWRIIAAASLAAGVVIGPLGGLGPVASHASSHREAPLTTADPQIDATDPDATLNFTQHYTLTEIRGTRTTTLVRDGIVAPSNVGAASMPNYSSLWNQAIYTISGGKTFAGPADDPFFLDLRVFDLLYGANL